MLKEIELRGRPFGSLRSLRGATIRRGSDSVTRPAMKSASLLRSYRWTDFGSGRSVFAETTVWLANRNSRVSVPAERRLVRKRGFEPPRGCPRQPLKLVRLPFRHFRKWA